MTTELTLWGEVAAPAAQAEPTLSADRKRTERQRELIAAGIHPLTRRQIHDDPERRCGNCWYRRLLDWHDKRHPKCLNDLSPTPTHGAATDVRASWPACKQYSYGDPNLSLDAARYVPEASDR